MSNLPLFGSWWFLVLAGVLLFSLLILVYLYVLVRRGRKKAAARTDPAQEATPEKDVDAFARLRKPVSKSELRTSFIRARSFLRATVGGGNYRYQLPWFLAVGDEGTGKTALLANASLSLLSSNGVGSVNQPRSGVNWVFFDDAVVLEVEGKAMLTAGNGDDEEEAWKDVLLLLQRFRRDQPIDGMVLTISCTDLVAPQRFGKEHELMLGEKASAWRQRLALAQRLLETSFPIYVLVTKCDQLAGFNGFCKTLPPKFRNEILGWSSPYALDSLFTTAWVDEAFESMHDRLHDLQLEMFAAPEDARNNDGIFVFPLELMTLQGPLGVYLSHIFGQSAVHQPFALRGIYFCGDGNAEPVIQPPPEAAPEMALAIRRPAPSRKAKPVFVHDVFDKKIFAENSLAQPIREGAFSKSRAIYVIQCLLLLLLLIGAPGLYFAHSRLKVVRDDLKKVLEDVSVGLSQAKDVKTYLDKENVHDCLSGELGRNDTAEEPGLYEKIANNRNKMSAQVREDLYLVADEKFSSYFVPRSWFGRVNEDLKKSLIPAFEHLILESLRLDLDQKTRELLGRSNVEISGFLREFDRLTENRTRYKLLSREGEAPLNDIRELFEYLKQPYSPHILTGKVHIYKEALREARGSELKTRNTHRCAVRNISSRVESIYEESLSKNTFKDTGKLHSYLYEITEAERLLARPDLTALASNRFEADSAFHGLTLVSGIRELRKTLEGLAGETFMKTFAAEQSPNSHPSNRGHLLLWDRGTLQKAISLYEEYDGYLTQRLDASSKNLQSTVREKTADKLKANLSVLLRQAKVQRPGNSALQGGFDNGLPEEIKSFREAEDLLSRLANICDRLGMRREYDEIVTNQSIHLLAEINGQFSREDYYQPAKSGLARWNGSQPASLAAYELSGPDELTAYLAANRKEIARFAREYAAPVIRFLTARNYGAGPLKNAPDVNWAEIITQLDKYDKMAPSSVAALENFILQEMDKVSPGQCPKVSSLPAAGDFFSRKRNELRQQIYYRCEILTGAELFARYTELQDFFNRHLAGKFPFARIGNEQTFAEADPEAISEFFRLADKPGKTLKDTLNKFALMDASVKDAREFLEQMEDVSAFLAPMISKTSPPVADFEIKFRVNQGREAGASQIIEWEFETGREKIRYRDPQRTLRWRLGEPLRLSMRWAKDSPSSPKAEGQLPHVRVNDRTAVFEFTNRWSLLALLNKHLAPAADFDPVVAPEPYLLSFTVWTHGGGKLLTGETSPLMKGFIRLMVMPPGKKEGLVLPSFPARAPQLGRESGVSVPRP